MICRSDRTDLIERESGFEPHENLRNTGFYGRKDRRFGLFCLNRFISFHRSAESESPPIHLPEDRGERDQNYGYSNVYPDIIAIHGTAPDVRAGVNARAPVYTTT